LNALIFFFCIFDSFAIKSDYQWTFYDFLATAADFAGVSGNDAPKTDGISMVPTLMGENQEQKEWVYHEYCDPNEQKGGWGQAVRIENYTGLCIGGQPQSTSDIPVCDKKDGFELYDLTTDIFQTNNIAKDNADIVDKMWNIMIEQHEEGDYCTDALLDRQWD